MPDHLALAESDTASKESNRVFFWLLVCFICSGISGLIYEVAWVRSLELIFGATTFAVATVLASFMGGLALGSYFMGRYAARLQKLHPLLLYGVLEVLIAVVAILIPLTFQALIPAYQWVWKVSHASFFSFSIIRFLLSALILLLPTFLMGATLPVVSDFVGRESALGKRRIGMLYACNTLGAVIGCLAAGLWLFPKIGLANTQWVAVGFNVAAALGAFLLARHQIRTSPARISGNEPARSEPVVGVRIDGSSEPVGNGSRDFLPAKAAHLLIAIYAVSGFVAMLYEVAWSRVLVMVLGSSTYAYTIMLGTFLFGLMLGAWISTRWFVKSTSPLFAAGFCQWGIALTSFAGVLLVEELPFYYLKAFEAFHPDATGLLSLQFLLSAGVMTLPTLGLGAMFPITINAIASARDDTARCVGRAYALNTVGAIVGSVVAGFWLVPQLGSQKTLLVGIALNALFGLAAVLAALPVSLRRYRIAFPLLIIVFCLNLFYSTPPWDPAVMSSGIFRYVRQYLGVTRERFRENARKITGELLLFKEGLTCTVTVFRNLECMSLLVNGKPDASTPWANPMAEDGVEDRPLHDLPTQTLLGQLPLLLAPQRDNVLVIGLGSGITLGSVLTHPVKSVECVELEDAVVRGSRFFEDFNGRPLSDPRAHLVVNDARNHLLVTPRKYDVIISEPSNPWIPGAANLFTREFFEMSKSRLQSNGLFCQWIQLYELQLPHFQTILRTFSSVYPEMHLFRVNDDAILVGSLQPCPLVESKLRARLTSRIAADLARIRVRNIEDLLAWYLIGGTELQSVLTKERFNTDDNMLIQFAAPLEMLAGHSKEKFTPFVSLFLDRTSAALSHVLLDESSDQAAFWVRVGQAALRSKSYSLAVLYAETSSKMRANPQALELLASALRGNGERDRALSILQIGESRFPDSPEVLRGLAIFHSRERHWQEAAGFAERLLALIPHDPVGLYCLGQKQFYAEDQTASLATFERIPPSLRTMDELEPLPYYLGSLYSRVKRHPQAIDEFRKFLKKQPEHVGARAQLAAALYESGDISAAVSQWQHIGRLNQLKSSALVSQAEVDSRSGRSDEGARKVEQALRLDGNNSELALLLARHKHSRGDREGAIELLRHHLRWHPDRPLVVGYLSQLLAGQNNAPEAKLLAMRYRALTGRSWEEIP